MASQYLATWVLLRIAGREDAEAAIRYVAPVGQKEEHVIRTIDVVRPYLPDGADG